MIRINLFSSLTRTDPARNRRPSVSIILLILFLSIILFPGCHHPKKGNGFGWRPSGNAMIDSLTILLDNGFIRRVSSDSLSSPLEMFGKAVTESEDPGIRFRDNLFRGWELSRQGHQDEAVALWKEAISSLDSAKNPYLYHMLDWMLDDDPTLTPSKYNRTIGRLKYFRSCHDDFMCGAMLTEAGNFLKDCHDIEGAIDAYDQADSLFRITGFAEQTVFNRINRASILAMSGDSVGATKVLEILLNDSAAKVAPGIRPIILENLYIYSEKDRYLDSLYLIRGDDPSSLMLRYRGLSAMNRGDFSEAIGLCRQAYDKAIEEENPEDLAWAMYALSTALAEGGKKVEAYDILNEASELTDEIGTIKNTEEIRGLETIRQLSEEKLRAEYADSKRILKWVWVAFAVFLIVIIGVWSSLLIIRNMKIRQLSLRLEREKMERKLIASSILLEGKERMLEKVGERIAVLSESPNPSPASTEDVGNSIRFQKMAEKGREGFMETYRETNPEFISRLKKKAPDLTETDIRFACYISIGMDNKAIAALTGIRHESVKQARWRLRKKLGLEKSDSLEDVLRNLSL